MYFILCYSLCLNVLNYKHFLNIRYRLYIRRVKQTSIRVPYGAYDSNLKRDHYVSLIILSIGLILFWNNNGIR